MTAGSTSHMRESFAEELLRKSVPQNKVAVRLLLNELCWCTSEACKDSISAILMGPRWLLAQLRYWLQKAYYRTTTDNIERFASAFAGKKVEAWNFTSKTFKTCQFNESRLFSFRLKSEHNWSGEKARNMHVSRIMLYKQGALKIFKCWNSGVVCPPY